jgi:hypothetical protein
LIYFYIISTGLIPETKNLAKMKTSINDILSILKNDNRFQGNQKHLQAINIAIANAKGDRSNLIAFANEVKSLIK